MRIKAELIDLGVWAGVFMALLLAFTCTFRLSLVRCCRAMMQPCIIS